MCIFNTAKQPDPPAVVAAPTAATTSAKEDTVGRTFIDEKKKKGYESTIATSGMGLIDTAAIKKATLGS